jgi:hypothetical protein
MQPTTEEQLVNLLELTQRERGRQEAKRNWRMVELHAKRIERTIDHGTMASRQRRKIIQRKPRGIPPDRRWSARRNQNEKND